MQIWPLRKLEFAAARAKSDPSVQLESRLHEDAPGRVGERCRPARWHVEPCIVALVQPGLQPIYIQKKSTLAPRTEKPFGLGLDIVASRPTQPVASACALAEWQRMAWYSGRAMAACPNFRKAFAVPTSRFESSRSQRWNRTIKFQ